MSQKILVKLKFQSICAIPSECRYCWTLYRYLGLAQYIPPCGLTLSYFIADRKNDRHGIAYTIPINKVSVQSR